MANFVEFQRALRALRVAGIIFGVMFLIALVGRVAASHGHLTYNMLGDIESSRTAHVTKQTLADGSTRTIVDDPVKRIHAVAIEHGSRMHLEVTEPTTSADSSDDHIMSGGFSINETHHGGMTRTVIDSNGPPVFPLGLLFATSIIMGFIVASLLGGVLAKENDGHLELAWTKPVSREQYALTAFAIDVLTVIVSQVLWVATIVICALLFFVPTLTFEPDAGVHIALSLLGAVGWYAAVTGWSASLKRGPGIVIGLGWLFATIVPGITDLLARSTMPVVTVIHAVLLALTYLDPLAYISLHVDSGNVSSSSTGALHLGMTTACLGLLALIVFYLAAALAQWRRVEA